MFKGRKVVLETQYMGGNSHEFLHYYAHHKAMAISYRLRVLQLNILFKKTFFPEKGPHEAGLYLHAVSFSFTFHLYTLYIVWTQSVNAWVEQSLVNV